MSARRNAHAFGSTPKIAIPLLGTRRRIHTRGMPEANADGAEPPAAKRSWFTAHPWIVTSLVAPLVVGLTLWGVNVAWNHFHPQHAPRMDVVNWYTTNQSTTQPATAHVRVHNDGDASAEGCQIHWVEVDPSGGVMTELAVSSGFGLAPNEFYRGAQQPAVIAGRLPAASALTRPKQLRTSVYVQCANNVRSSLGLPISVLMTPPAGH
jgi:hypothetical protein